MQVLSYGFLLPESGDRGANLWAALESDITKLNNHNHDGSNSAQLTKSAIVGVSQTISSSGWSAVDPATGLYSQTVSMPSGLTFDSYDVKFKISASSSPGEVGRVVMLSYSKASANTYVVYSNRNDVSFLATYV